MAFCRRTLCEYARGAQPQQDGHRGGHPVLRSAVQEVWFQVKRTAPQENTGERRWADRGSSALAVQGEAQCQLSPSENLASVCLNASSAGRLTI